MTQNETEKNGCSNTAANNVNEVAARVDDIPHNLMIKCESFGAMLVTKDWLRDLRVCPRCNHHSKLGARERIDLLADAGRVDGELQDSGQLPRSGLTNRRTARVSKPDGL